MYDSRLENVDYVCTLLHIQLYIFTFIAQTLFQWSALGVCQKFQLHVCCKLYLLKVVRDLS